MDVFDVILITVPKLMIILYIILFIWLLFEMPITILIEKRNYKETYKIIKQELIEKTSNTALFKFFKNVSKILLILFFINFSLFTICVISFVLWLFLLIFFLGAGSNFFASICLYLSPCLVFMIILFYLLLYLFLIKSIVTNILFYKKLKSCQSNNEL